MPNLTFVNNPQDTTPSSVMRGHLSWTHDASLPHIQWVTASGTSNQGKRGLNDDRILMKDIWEEINTESNLIISEIYKNEGVNDR
jgi:hypothetical protein